MVRRFTTFSLFSASVLASVCGHAQTAALLVAREASQLSEVQLAKVVAEDSSLWLSARFHGRTRLALVVAGASVESAPAAHAWLGALDFGTRVRVAAPPGSLSGCGSSKQYALADTGLPEPRRVAASEVFDVGSELELRRRLAELELPTDIERSARFASRVEPPFRVHVYDLPETDSSIDTLRLVDHGHARELPRIELSGVDSVPLSLILLARGGVQSFPEPSADPSEFPTTYRALDGSSDYLAARSGWLARNPGWLNEVQESFALFAATTLAPSEQIDSVASRYFLRLSGAATSACQARVLAAHGRGSTNTDDFVCDGADDLSRSLAELDFGELGLSRFFGALGSDGAVFQAAPSAPRGPLLVATDFDANDCVPELSLPTGPAGTSEPTTKPPGSSAPVVVNTPNEPVNGSTTGPYSGGSSTTVVVSSSNDSCSSDTRSRESSNDSCSGSSSSSDSETDSCSGDSSDSSDSETDSCSGDSSDSSDSETDSCSSDSSDSSSDSCSGNSESDADDSGCGNSGYDGDTCTGDTAESNSSRAKSAGLGAGSNSTSAHARPRPRPLRLSLLTWLAAALALPLRRLRAWR